MTRRGIRWLLWFPCLLSAAAEPLRLPEPGPADRQEAVAYAKAVDKPAIRVSAKAKPGSGDGSEERPFATVAEGLAKASEGDRVMVMPGIYREKVRIGKGVWLCGCGYRTCVLLGEFKAGEGISGVVEGADGARLSGFTVSSTERDRGWGYLMQGEKGVRIEDCLFTGLYVGIHCNNATGAKPEDYDAYEPAPMGIVHNVFYANHHSGVAFGWTAAPEIERNVFIACGQPRREDSGGVYYFSGDPKLKPRCRLAANVLWRNEPDYGSPSAGFRKALAERGAQGGDIRADPLVEAARLDFMPKSGSPCLPKSSPRMGIRPAKERPK